MGFIFMWRVGIADLFTHGLYITANPSKCMSANGAFMARR